MNKTAIRNFAIWARNKLIADISYKAGLMGITKDGIADALPQSTADVEFYDIGTAEPYTIRGEEIEQRKGLVQIIKQKEKETDYITAYNSVIEEVAYTWFNRLIAVRFMEVNDYMPSHIRVLSSETGKLEPDLVTTPFDAELDFSDAEIQQIIQLKNDNKLDEVFRLLFIKQCNALHSVLPLLFESTSDYTELLLNVSFIDIDSVVYHLLNDIPEEDFNIEQGGQVEIIGWLYQFYNAELKEEVINYNKSTTRKEDIPAATQLFTTDWVVRYLIDNSLGKFWLEHSKNSRLIDSLEFYVSSDDIRERESDNLISPLDIKILDPCMGSGHFLVYAFELLIKIYTECGYAEREAAELILEKNIFGLDIDDRAAQLAYFAVLMKARQYNRRILSKKTTCNVLAFKESKGIDRSLLNSISDRNRSNAEKIVAAFENAKELGSIISLDLNECDIEAIKEEVEDIISQNQNGNLVQRIEAISYQKEFMPLIEQADILVKKYTVVMTNPPYLSRFSPVLKSYITKHYKNYGGDLFSVFIYRNFDYCVAGGYSAFMTPNVWLFISTYEKLRRYIVENKKIDSLILLAKGAFYKEATVDVCPFVLRNEVNQDDGKYISTVTQKGDMEEQRAFVLEIIRNKNPKQYFEIASSRFEEIPGYNIGFWLTDADFNIFSDGTDLKNISKPKTGMRTGDNDRFLRLWYEINDAKFGKRAANSEEAVQSGKKWFPYNKGGDFRKWFGNNSLVVNWENDGKEIKDNTRKVYPQLGDNLGWKITNEQDYFKEGITWTALTSGTNSFRYSPKGFIFDSNKGPMLFAEDGKQPWLLGLLNSKVTKHILEILNPTLSLQNGDLEKLPIVGLNENVEIIGRDVDENIDIEKKDWDSFETSWDFKKHPLI